MNQKQLIKWNTIRRLWGGTKIVTGKVRVDPTGTGVWLILSPQVAVGLFLAFTPSHCHTRELVIRELNARTWTFLNSPRTIRWSGETSASDKFALFVVSAWRVYLSIVIFTPTGTLPWRTFSHRWMHTSSSSRLESRLIALSNTIKAGCLHECFQTLRPHCCKKLKLYVIDMK